MYDEGRTMVFLRLWRFSPPPPDPTTKAAIDLHTEFPLSTVSTEKLRGDILLWMSMFDDVSYWPSKNQASSKASASVGGMTCSGACHEFNEYAEPNRPDGTYVCYSCRRRP